MSIYDFEVTTSDGATLRLNQFQGRVILIVNVASKCSFTPQYAGLESLYRKYKDRGFEVLGFPCNQFLWQEPGDTKECRLKYDVSFPVFAKIKVNGPGTHPLYRYLKRTLRGTLGTGFIKWNFSKFLVNRHGEPVKRFGMFDTPRAIEPAIETALSEPSGASLTA